MFNWMVGWLSFFMHGELLVCDTSTRMQKAVVDWMVLWMWWLGSGQGSRPKSSSWGGGFGLDKRGGEKVGASHRAQYELTQWKSGICTITTPFRF